jgi:hypothetical protein
MPSLRVLRGATAALLLALPACERPLSISAHVLSQGGLRELPAERAQLRVLYPANWAPQQDP